MNPPRSDAHQPSVRMTLQLRPSLWPKSNIFTSDSLKSLFFATNVITARSNIWALGAFKLWLWLGAALVVLESDLQSEPTKHRHYVFSFHAGWDMSEQHLSYCIDDFLTGTFAADFRSKLWNKPHEDSRTAVRCITDLFWAKITMSVCFKNSLTGIRGPINVSRLCAQDCRAIKHSSVTSSKTQREQEKKGTLTAQYLV